MKVVQVKGSNGSGKTTIAKQLIARSHKVEQLVDADNPKKVYVTAMRDIGWAVIGAYPEGKKMGGCDCMKSVHEIKTAIRLAIKYYSDCDIMFEGMMISTIKSTFYDFLLKLEKRLGIQPRFVILESSLEGCLERIAGRGTMKDGLNHDNIKRKCEMVVEHSKSYNQKYVGWMRVDNIDKDEMLEVFLGVI